MRDLMASGKSHHSDPVLPWTKTAHDRRFHTLLQFCLVIALAAGVTIPYLPVPTDKHHTLSLVLPHLANPTGGGPGPVSPQPGKAGGTVKHVQLKGVVITEQEFAGLRQDFTIPILIQNHRFPSSHPHQSTIPGPENNREKGKARTAPLTTNKHTRRRHPARSHAEIAAVFAENYSAIFSLYSRALRKTPGLQGRVVLELTITPQGRVSQCRILASELSNPSLEKKLVARIKRFRFKPKQIKPVTITYPIDFLPS